MTRPIDLSDDDRNLFIEIVEATGMSRKTLALQSEVTQSWLSQVLNGKHTKIDSDMLNRIAHTLTKGLQECPKGGKFNQDRVTGALTFLSRFTDSAVEPPPTKIYPPGGPVPVDASHYINSTANQEVLSGLARGPFTLLVRGPVQCGKSSLLARLEKGAREIGIETAWFDPRIPVSPSPQRGSQETDVNRAAAMALSELLETQWNLELPKNSTTDSIPRLVNWMLRALGPTASKPRLLIVDDLASLGPRAAEDWLSLFFRALHNKRATGGPQLSIAVAITAHFGPAFSRRLL